MSRFDFDCDEGGMPWAFWEAVVSRALAGRKGQEALATVEEALLALPERKLINDHLAIGGDVCAVGAYVAYQEALAKGIDLELVIDAMGVGVACWCDHGLKAHGEGGCTGKDWKGEPCTCVAFEPDNEDGIWGTAEAGRKAGLTHTVAWHLAYLNDETFSGASPEERYEMMLAWVRRAQGKQEAVAA